MNHSHINSQISRFKNGYLDYGKSLLGLIESVTGLDRPVTIGDKAKIINQSAALFDNWKHSASDVWVTMASISSGALIDAGVKGDIPLVREFASDLAVETARIFVGQGDRDRQAVVRYVSEFMLEASRTALASGRDLVSAQRALRSYKPALHRVFLDKAGRAWKGERFVETLLNGAFYKVYNESFLYALGQQGTEVAVLSFADSSDPRNGLELSVLPHNVLPTYHELQGSIINPNSMALVKKKH